MTTTTSNSKLKHVAQAGLIGKGIVYVLFGILTFMAAFNLNGRSVGNTDKSSVFEFVQRQTGGQVLLGVIALGLVCYCIWRFIQAFADTEDKGTDAKGLAKRGRYLFSGIVYGILAFSVGRMLWSARSSDSGGNTQQDIARELLSQPFGQIIAGIGALVLLGVGVYQIYYGFSEKYKKHVDKVISGDARKQKVLLASGKIGYIARGIVWLLLGWLFLKAAWNANSSNAGDTSEAFSFLHEAAYGSYLLGAVGFGLLCYGIFAFIRAGYEDLG